MGYNDTYTCEALITWKSDNEINCASQFEEGADQIEYYGGMGMPTIVIVGRNTHKVYFNEFGFVPADTVAFAEAIEYALGIAEPISVIEEKFKNISITPNPASEFIHITDLRNSPFTLTIINANGAIIQTMEEVIVILTFDHFQTACIFKGSFSGILLFYPFCQKLMAHFNLFPKI